MPKSRSTAISVPLPSDQLRADLDVLAADIVRECKGEDVSLDTKIDALKTVGAYWGLTRKGVPQDSASAGSAFTGYRQSVNGAAREQAH